MSKKKDFVIWRKITQKLEFKVKNQVKELFQEVLSRSKIKLFFFFVFNEKNMKMCQSLAKVLTGFS